MRPALLPFLAVLALVPAAGADPAPPAAAAAPALTRDFRLDRRYLNFPIRNGAPKRKVRIAIDGRPELALDMELAEAQPDWWAFLDTAAWRGRQLTAALDMPAALAQIDLTAEFKNAGELYQEALRPQFHFSARRGWINDPTGLSFYRGEYHLFFEHNPYGRRSALPHWGHAVSTDLVHWRELGEALAPDALGAIWSGSGVVDWANRSGFGSATLPPQVLIYTSAGRTFGQSLAFSTDGRTYVKFAGNPVVPEILWGNRDPKVFWYPPGRTWIMCVYVGPTKATPDARGRPAVSAAHTIQFLASPDLKHWTRRGHTSGFFECPNLVELPLDGNPARRQWVLTDASSDYMVGRFDGNAFLPDTAKIRGHSGEHVNFYAAQIFSDLPAADGRCLQIGWLPAPSPGMPFNQALSLPLELRLISTPAGPRLTWTPARELQVLRERSIRPGVGRLGPGRTNPFAGMSADLQEVRADFAPGTAERITFTVRGIPVIYDVRRQEVIVNHHAAAAPLQHGRQTLAIYIDRTTLEVFASGGLTYVPVPLIAAPQNRSLGLAIDGGAADFSVLEAHALRPIWPPRAGDSLPR